MRPMVWLSIGLLTGALATSYAWSAGAIKVAVLLENDQVKVLRVTKNGETHVTTDSDDHLIIPLNDFTSKETRDGKVVMLERKKGQAYWRQGGARSYDETATADMIVVDLKPGKGTTLK
jgi:hypothetical protein